MIRPEACLLVASLVVSACAHSAPPPQPPTPTRPALPLQLTATPIPTLDLDDSLDTPVSPSPTPPPVPLSPNGPWLALLAQNHRILGMDFSGPGEQYLPSPSDADHPCDGISSMSAAPRGGFLSFKCLTPALDHELWVVSLPSGEVIARLPLLGEEALEADATRIEDQDYWAPPAQTAVEDGQQIWSPSGRYLAYSGAPSSPSTDVYVFDTVTRTNHHLTSGPGQTEVLGWSPDSRWIVHTSFLHRDVDTYVDAVWAVSQDGATLAKLYDIDGWIINESILGWESNNEVITVRSHFEACDSDLRATVIGEASQLLHSGGFFSATYDPINGDAIVAESTQYFCTSESPGLFALDTDTREVQQITDSGYWSISWSPILGALIARSDSDTTDIVSRSGQVKVSLPDLYSLDPSPDGQWLLAHSDAGVSLLSSAGDPVFPSLTEKSAEAIWHPNSSEFVVLECPPCSPGATRLHLYSLLAGWQPMEPRELPISVQPRGLTLVPK